MESHQCNWATFDVQYCNSILAYAAACISRVSDQNGVSPLYIVLEIHHSGPDPLIYRG